MNFDAPTIVYTAESNVEVHLVVELLRTNGIDALAVEDQSGVSLWAFGTISQFHKPNVYVDKKDEAKAIELVRAFEETKTSNKKVTKDGNGQLTAKCEECGEESRFSAAQDGTTQECAHCNAYIDVGDFTWEDDVGEPED